MADRINGARRQIEKGLDNWQPRPLWDRQIYRSAPVPEPTDRFLPSTPSPEPVLDFPKRPLDPDFSQRSFSPDEELRYVPPPTTPESFQVVPSPETFTPGTSTRRPSRLPSRAESLGRAKALKRKKVTAKTDRPFIWNWNVDLELPAHYRENRSKLFIIRKKSS